MMAVFANGGKLVNPHIIKAIDGRDVSFQHTKKTPLHIKEKNIGIIRKGLREVVSDSAGTANVLASLAVEVAGKTGTAQIGAGKAHGWFVGFFPFEKPKFVICVFLEKAGHGYAACLVTKQIIELMSQEGLI
jgi:penicillin-binding protein 2